ncbi:unnamed protein product [Cyclocybe aegerita]|uniref:HNH nuclease domain-containing protein n=1 Tax=Cyclocybe aegerita TaxID=1973307 RepID=A0A8S0W442_CYCAE|nr:unnamed protein product [Cyclocybe aegerita]
MAEAPPEIEVHALFPDVVAFGPNLDIFPNKWHWAIRYPIGVVVGARGDLMTGPDSLNVVDYDARLPSEATILYYHMSDEEKRRMFPAGSHILCTSITPSVPTTRKVHFCDQVAQRDGGRCVLTRMIPDACDAVHLLAHSKGDAYIETYTQRRSRDPTGGDIVREIESVRNGLFLNKFTHVALGTHIAFLMRPNFAMNTADVDLATPPGEKKRIAHLFRPDKKVYLGGFGAPPPGSPLHISEGSTRPPNILFDAVYAGAVLNHFGTDALKAEFGATWQDVFYPNGIMTAAYRGDQAINDLERGKKSRQTRHAHGSPICRGATEQAAEDVKESRRGYPGSRAEASEGES